MSSSWATRRMESASRPSRSSSSSAACTIASRVSWRRGAARGALCQGGGGSGSVGAAQANTVLDENIVRTLERCSSCRAFRFPSPLPYRWRWVVLGIVLAAEIMDLVDATITSIAAPSVVRDIGGGDTTMQWLAAAYTLAFAVGLITGGRLGDIVRPQAPVPDRRHRLRRHVGPVRGRLVAGLSSIAFRALQGALRRADDPPGPGRGQGRSSRPRRWPPRSACGARSWPSRRSPGRSWAASWSTPTSPAWAGARSS